MSTWRDLRLDQTCWGCPEQYDVFLDREEVGYLRLRHGRFTVEAPFGNTIWVAYPEGDGAFEDHERDRYLDEAKQRIWAELQETGEV